MVFAVQKRILLFDLFNIRLVSTIIFHRCLVTITIVAFQFSNRLTFMFSDISKIATTTQENVINSTSARMSPITSDSQSQPPLIVFNGAGQPPQSSVSVTNVSMKQEMTTTTLTSTHFSLQTQDTTVVSSTQAKLKPKSNNAPFNHLLKGISSFY